MLILVDEKEIECLSLSEKPLFLLKKLQSLWLHHYRSRNEAGVGRAAQREREHARVPFPSTMHHFGLN